MHFYHTYIGLQCVRVHTFSCSIPPQSLKMAVGATSELCNYLQDRGFIGVNETGYIERMFPGYCLKIFILFSSDKKKSLRIFYSIHFYSKKTLGSKQRSWLIKITVDTTQTNWFQLWLCITLTLNKQLL